MSGNVSSTDPSGSLVFESLPQQQEDHPAIMTRMRQRLVFANEEVAARKKRRDEVAELAAEQMALTAAENEMRALDEEIAKAESVISGIIVVPPVAQTTSPKTPGTATEPGRTVFTDADGKEYGLAVKRLAWERLESSRAFRRVCLENRLSELLPGDGIDLMPAKILQRLQAEGNLQRQGVFAVGVWNSTGSWEEIRMFAVFRADTWKLFTAFNPELLDWDTLSLQHFTQPANISLANKYHIMAALDGIGKTMKFTFGNIWEAAFSPIVARIRDGDLQTIEVGFLRHKLEGVFHGFVRNSAVGRPHYPLCSHVWTNCWSCMQV